MAPVTGLCFAARCPGWPGVLAAHVVRAGEAPGVTAVVAASPVCAALAQGRAARALPVAGLAGLVAAALSVAARRCHAAAFARPGQPAAQFVAAVAAEWVAGEDCDQACHVPQAQAVAAFARPAPDSVPAPQHHVAVSSQPEIIFVADRRQPVR